MPTPTRPAEAVAATTRPPEADPTDDVPRGCAWFDSSLDLNRGLRVRELDLADPRCGAAFLEGWLAWASAAPARHALQA